MYLIIEASIPCSHRKSDIHYRVEIIRSKLDKGANFPITSIVTFQESCLYEHRLLNLSMFFVGCYPVICQFYIYIYADKSSTGISISVLESYLEILLVDI